MATNICLDCIHFLACNKASEETTKCNDYKFIRREIKHDQSIKKISKGFR